MKNRSALFIFLVTIVFFTFPITFNKPGIGQSSDSKIVKNQMLTLYSRLYAAEKTEKSKSKPAPVVMEKGPADSGKLFKVMVVIMIIWFGLAYYLFRLDRKITKLEKDINEL